MLDFSNDFFETEERCGFVVDQTMKTVWAAEMEVLAAISEVCTKYDLPFFADYGTLLGVVRHDGFVPWDDDIDIAMKRQDFNRLMEVLPQELPEGFIVHSPLSEEGCDQFWAYVTNGDHISIAPEHLNRFHGCPFVVGVDIYPLDYLPRDQRKQETHIAVHQLVRKCMQLVKESDAISEELVQALNKLNEVLGCEIVLEKPLIPQLQRVISVYASQYTEEESDALTMFVRWVGDPNYVLEKEWYEEALLAKFENVFLPVPVGYEGVLIKEYGEDYMTPIQGQSSHDYPCYKRQLEQLHALLEKNEQVVFPENYFEGEVRNGFYIRPMVKKSWAAQIEVLREIDRVCKKYDITYFAAWGTMLGAVRHQGFVPWDDDIDIGMKRDDYRRFLQVAPGELQGMTLLSLDTTPDYDALIARVVNGQSVNWSEEHLQRYHGCPYSVGIDIFPQDYLPADEQGMQEMVSIYKMLVTLANAWPEDNAYATKELWENARQVSELLNVPIDENQSVKRKLYVIADAISGMYTKEDGGDIAQVNMLTIDLGNRLPQDMYETVDMPFENITIPVIKGAKELLAKWYGPDYMTPKNVGSSHEYPAFREQERALVESFTEKGLEIPAEFDVAWQAPKGWYAGVQYHTSLQMNAVVNAQVTCLEVWYDDLEGVIADSMHPAIQGVMISQKQLLVLGIRKVLEKIEKYQIPYLVIETIGAASKEELEAEIKGHIEEIREGDYSIYLENGYSIAGNGSFVSGPFGDAEPMKAFLSDWNGLCGRYCFGMCLNVGYANLLGRNLRNYVDLLGKDMKLVHMSDNDGIHDVHQLPLTFACGRGTSPSTDVFRVIGALARIGYEGGIIFDTVGLWKRLPVGLQESYMTLMMALAKEWERIQHQKEDFADRSKKIILFGTGGMAYNYLCEWADQYPPYMFVDNNEKKWGTEIAGIPVCSPEKILEIPAEERRVYICNQYYNQIGEQLRSMGIAFECYNDNYYR